MERRARLKALTPTTRTSHPPGQLADVPASTQLPTNSPLRIPRRLNHQLSEIPRLRSHFIADGLDTLEAYWADHGPRASSFWHLDGRAPVALSFRASLRMHPQWSKMMVGRHWHGTLERSCPGALYRRQGPLAKFSSCQWARRERWRAGDSGLSVFCFVCLS
jgi:hypothetical protein